MHLLLKFLAILCTFSLSVAEKGLVTTNVVAHGASPVLSVVVLSPITITRQVTIVLHGREARVAFDDLWSRRVPGFVIEEYHFGDARHCDRANYTKSNRVLRAV